MKPDVERAIREYLKKRFRAYRDDLSIHDSLRAVVDSIGQFEMVEYLEGVFNFRIPNEEFHPDRLSTIARIGETIQEFAGR